MAGYIGSKASVVSSGAERKTTITATSGQTSLTGLSYTPNQVHVFQNGVRLVDGTDYTATNGSSITLTVGASTDDQIVVVSYATFETSDTVSASAGGTFSGDVSFGDSVKAKFGASNDLQIYHDGNHSYIQENGTGDLLVGATNFQLKSGDYGETMLTATDDGSVTLFYNNAAKLTTNNTGIVVTGSLGIGTTSPAEELDISADAPSMQLSSTNGSGRNYGLQSTNDGKFAFYDGTAGVNRMVLDSSGKLGIGTTSPDLTLDVTHGTASEYVATFQNTGDNLELKIGTSTGGMLNIQGANASNNNAYAFGLNADGGNVGIGTNSPDALAHIYSGASGVTNPHSYTKLHIESSSHAAIQLSGSTGGEQWIWFADDTSSTPVGGITYYHGENYMAFRTNGGEKIRISQHGELIGPANNNFDIFTGTGTGDMRFFTNGTQKFSIEPNGRQSNLANVSGNLAKFENQHSSSPDILWLRMSNDAPDNNSQYFVYCSDSSTLRCAIWSDGDIDNHDNSYGGTSDQKLKQQITDASSQWDDIKALQVRKFKFNSDVETGDSDEHWRLGVIAQEVESAGMSGLVNDRVDKDEDGNALETTTKSVKYSVLYMKAVKALQEAMARIETLETEVAALKQN